MAYYAEWEDIVTKVLELIRNNDELLHYACNSSGDPISEPIPEWSKILMNHVFPVPKDPESVGTQKAFINVFMNTADPYYKNPFYRQDYLNIEVVCHLETWMMDNGRIRPYVMINLIDEMLNNKNLGEISIMKVYGLGAKCVKFGDMFYGYKLIYKLSNPGAVDCEK